MRLVVLVTVLLALGVDASVAHACSCVVPGTPREDLANADAAFFGTVVDREVLDEGQPGVRGDEYVRYTFRVDVDYKENLPSQILLDAPVQTAACGFDLDPGDELGMLLDRDTGEYFGGACSVRSKAFLDAGSAATPDPAATPPARFLAAGGFGAPRVAGLDALGRLLGYGRGPGFVEEVSICPGAHVALETVLRLEGIHDGIAVRRLADFGQSNQRFVGLTRNGAHYEVIEDAKCLRADATRIAVFITDSRLPNARLVLLGRAGGGTVWRGKASAVTFRGRRAWIDGPRGIRAVHVRTGAVRQLRRLPSTGKPLAFSPNGRTLALNVDGELQFVDVETGALLGARFGAGSDVVWLDNNRFVLRRGGRTRLLDRRANLIADSLPGTGAFTARGGQLVMVEGDRLVTYDRDGFVVTESGPLFSDGITSLTALPLPRALRARTAACL